MRERKDHQFGFAFKKRIGVLTVDYDGYVLSLSYVLMHTLVLLQILLVPNRKLQKEGIGNNDYAKLMVIQLINLNRRAYWIIFSNV